MNDERWLERLGEARERALARVRSAEYRTPEWASRPPSTRVLEMLGEARAIGGAFRFHQWAASELPPNVREHYGDRFVLGVHQLLAGSFRALSEIHNLFDEKPVSSVSLECLFRNCPTDDNGERADWLIGRFYFALKNIDSAYIKEWYFDLDGQDANDVRAFFRVAASSDSRIRGAYEQILLREESPAIVTVEGNQGNESEALRDAFLCTAIQAAHEATKISILGKGGCRSRAAVKFDMKADAVRKAWKKFEKAHESPRI